MSNFVFYLSTKFSLQSKKAAMSRAPLYFLSLITLLTISQIESINYRGTVKFNLYFNKKLEVLKNGNIESILSSNFNKKLPLRILIHGWLPVKLIDMEQEVSKAWEEKGGLNIIWVDFSELAENIVYFEVARHVAPIGKEIASFIDFLYNKKLIKLEELYLVGFALGAHVAGNFVIYKNNRKPRTMH